MNLYSFGNAYKCNLPKMEDAIYVGEVKNHYVFIVADGNGGLVGDINIGQLATNVLLSYLEKIITEDTDSKTIRDSLDLGMYLVSQAILSVNAIDSKYENVYVSLSVVIIDKSTYQMVYASTGNTEIQMIRNQNFRRLNRVYSEAYDALMKGDIEEKDFYVHPGRALLTSALGVFPQVSTDIMSVGMLQTDDILLLTTDGIYRYITPNRVIEIMADADTIEDGVNNVLNEVNDLGGEDNASLIVIHLY